MKKWVNVKLIWLSREEGGRKNTIPVNVKYCPIIIFDNDTKYYDSWSADIMVDSYISQYQSIAKMSYLSEEAPYELLCEGAKFKLCEGARLVATGVIYLA